MRSGSRGYCTLLEDVHLVAMNTEASRDVRHVTKPSGKREKPVFRRMEEENRQAQPQLYGTQYFSVRNTLTGQLASGVRLWSSVADSTAKPAFERTRQLIAELGTV